MTQNSREKNEKNKKINEKERLAVARNVLNAAMDTSLYILLSCTQN